MKLDISYGYTKPDMATMSGSRALSEAQSYKNDKNYPYMSDLVNIVLNEKNYLVALYWVMFIKTHIIEMYTIISDVNNYPSMKDYYVNLVRFLSKTDYDSQNIFQIILFSNCIEAYAMFLGNYNNNSLCLSGQDDILLVKSRVIELGVVEEVVSAISQSSPDAGTYAVKLEAFYDNVPEEYKLGVI